MKIAIIGYGKMGKAIEKLAISQGHEILLKIDKSNSNEMTSDNLKACDVAIEFSGPSAAFENIKACLDARLPVVSGSTGWLDQLALVNEIATENKIGFLQSSNFSIGVNIFRLINQRLTQLMNDQPMYKASMLEIHHTEKLDAPSGTAIFLAEDIISDSERIQTWTNSPSEKEENIEILSERKADVKGTHIIRWESLVDKIEIQHEANSRDGFALGAIAAAEWIRKQDGPKTMSDFLGL